MRDLTSQLVSRFTNTSDDDSVRVVWIQSQDLIIIDHQNQCQDDAKETSQLAQNNITKSSQITINQSHEKSQVILRNALLINLSNNKLTSKTLYLLWKKFPCSWWLVIYRIILLILSTISLYILYRVNLSKNCLSDLCSIFPLALGSLDLTDNTNIQEKDYPFITKSHILRLSINLPTVSEKEFIKYVTK